MINFNDIEKARDRIKGKIKKTPLVNCPTLDKITNGTVFFKLENLQTIGSFKIRGAMNRIMALSPEEKAKGVIAASAGNHAQGVAISARNEGIEATIVMPRIAPMQKVEATQSFGAKVVLHGDTFDEAFAKAVELQKEHGYTFVHPFNDEDVISGQGTIGVEILEEEKDIDTIICPIGGGGMIAGIAIAAKHMNKDIKIIGVQTSNMPSMVKALENGKPYLIKGEKTIADGIAVGVPGINTFEIVEKYVDEVVTVTEDEISNAMLFLLERSKVVAEGAGATALAGVLAKKIDLNGRKAAIVVSGGNVDITSLERIINKALILEKRRAKLVISIGDSVGKLNQVTKIMTDNNANILYLTQTRFDNDLLINEQALEIVIECLNKEHLDRVLEALKNENLKYKIS